MAKGQLKLTAALAALAVLVVLVWGSLAERGLRRAELERIERDLAARAGLVAELVGDRPFDRTAMADLDAVADRAGAASGTRVSLIARDGRVLGDSEIPLERLATVESHADRPEVRAALEGGTGTSMRRSATVGRELFYLARPVAGGAGLVRVALDLDDLQAAVARLRRELVAAGGVGLALAILLSFGLSWYTLRPIREMRRVASSIAEGHLEDRLPRGHGDELAEISSAINQMAEQLRLRLEQATREKEQLHGVLEAMVEGVLVVDTKGITMLANSRLREFYEMTDEATGRPWVEAIRNAELDAVLREAAETDAIVSRDVSVGHPVARTLRVQAVRFPGEGTPRIGTVAVLHDVSELMRLEEVRRDFVANASHELRTPLAAIRGFAETLLHSEGLEAKDLRSYLEIIDRHAQRLGVLVDDLLSLSAIEGRKLPVDFGAVDVAALADGLVRDWEPRLREARLDARVEKQGSAVAWADAHAVEQVLINLLDNAVKYTEPGGAVEIFVREHGDRVRVRVSDSGIGIPAEDLGRVFERFYRVDKARSRALGGTGLGLAIVKHLVQTLGGEIRVESELGHGTSFHFHLPSPPQG